MEQCTTVAVEVYRAATWQPMRLVGVEYTEEPYLCYLARVADADGYETLVPVRDLRTPQPKREVRHD